MKKRHERSDNMKKIAIVIFIIGRIVLSLVRKLFKKIMNKSNIDEGVVKFLDSMIKVFGYIVIIITICGQIGIQTTSFITLLGTAGVSIGLALQGSLANFAGGILILLLKPFVVGDYIVVNSEGIEGTVKLIQIFYTRLTTIDNKTIIVPNGILTDNSLTNVTARPERQLDLKVGISYDSDLKKAKELIEHMLYGDDDVIQDEEIKVFVDELADSSVVIGLRAWVKTDAYWATRWRVLEEIKLTFDAEGIEIPYNQLTVHMKQD